MKQFQQQVAVFVQQNQLEIPLDRRLLDLVSEVGELAKESLSGSLYGRQRFVPGAGWADEIGDVLFALICLANTSGVDLEDALQDALNKYQARLSSTRQIGSGR
ncbi:MAG: MazG nucleotide pyrophosphohydrolase domain-containing protein [Chloroflexota bacterium]